MIYSSGDFAHIGGACSINIYRHAKECLGRYRLALYNEYSFADFFYPVFEEIFAVCDDFGNLVRVSP